MSRQFQRRSRADCEPAKASRLTCLGAIARAYRMYHREREADQLRSFAGEPTLRKAIRRAGLAQRPDGKRYNHQRRIPGATLRHVEVRLQRAGLDRATTFDRLHRMVAECIESIHGIGALMIYDTALRIGAKLGLAPERVYLHAGTREGARALRLDWRAGVLDVSAFPLPLRELEPNEIEDCLCIFADDLRALRVLR